MLRLQESSDPYFDALIKRGNLYRKGLTFALFSLFFY
jgi:hypothetical protein